MLRGKFSFHNILVFLTVAVALCAGAAVSVSSSVDSATCDTEGVWSLGVRTMGETVTVTDETTLKIALASTDVSVINFGNDISLTHTIGITRNVAINGNSKTLSGGTNFSGPVISIDAATTINIDRLTITGGNNTNGGGGGILVSGDALIRDSTISGNSAHNGGGIEIFNGNAYIYNSNFAAKNVT